MTTAALTLPPDIRAMLTSIELVLASDIPKAHPGDPESRDAPERRFTGAELEALTSTYRGHIETLIPAVQAQAERLPSGHPDRVTALLCVGQARIHLRLGPGDTDAIRGSIASRMARSVRTLCGHYDRLVPR
ncbi:hypothetical protein JHN63_01770 [Streptomyces sp. MBT65]|uniref:DUF6415 family natural product biosynthesis protein n=1 Tax=Streptomyces sp. MBT65 TaxID=1488395 RepID=UPI00190C2398|nr:DUF6415 family natural product biosynthesis protein [Streptomyces sp. MBT65]MBK3572569.1 hypothetical protein [Streptomyces sp. MBT65]